MYGYQELTEPKDNYTNCRRRLVFRTTIYTTTCIYQAFPGEWDGSDSELAAENCYMQRAKTCHRACARAAALHFNHIITYNKFSPQYARKLAEHARITMDWAVKELK